MKIRLTLLVSLFTVGFALSASAGAVTDTDADLVPDAFDNCSADQNGPGQASNQVDTDVDGFGNVCDADFNNDNGVDGGDFGLFVAAFNSTTALYDLTGDGQVDGADFGRFVALFNAVPGPSGLACAGTIPCTP
jgi:hypothetical protein